MKPILYEGRFCRLEVPWNWHLVPGAGAFQESRNTRRSTVLIEDWLRTPMSAATYAEKQKALLADQYGEVEELEARSFGSEDLGDVYWVAFGSLAGPGPSLRQELLTPVNGPLVCCLALTARADDQEAWKEIFPQIYRSFEIHARGWAREIQREPLFAEEIRPENGGLIAVPEWQISFPAKPGWRLDQDAGRLYHEKGAEILVRRSGLSSVSPDALFVEALAQAHRDSARTIRTWDQGETRQGWSFFALESSEMTKKTWGPEKVSVFREIFLADESALAVSLRAQQGDTEALDMLSSLVSESNPLPPEQREIRIREPWIKTRMSGHWISPAPGLYIHQGDPEVMLIVQRFPQASNLASLRQNAPEALRRQLGIGEAAREELVEGAWKSLDALRYSFEFLDREERLQMLRAAWIAAPRATYELVTVSSEAPRLDQIFLQVLQDLDSAAMAQSL